MNRFGSRASGMAVAGSAAVLAGLLVAGCTEDGRPGGEGGQGTATAPATGGTSPLENPDGVKPGLAPITSEEEQEAARRLIEKLSIKGRGPRTGYDRDEFGYAWMDTADGVPLARNGCDTRNDLMARDGQDLRYRAGSDCVVVAMTLLDPYTGKDIVWRKTDASAVQIDHVVPLSYAWQMGASRWAESKREQLANDVLNLVPVSGPANSAKRDSGPASWLPPDRQVRCSYAVRFSQVALKYELPVTAPDKKMMLKQCGA